MLQYFKIFFFKGLFGMVLFLIYNIFYHPI
jgi:hypothetical protein